MQRVILSVWGAVGSVLLEPCIGWHQKDSGQIPGASLRLRTLSSRQGKQLADFKPDRSLKKFTVKIL